MHFTLAIDMDHAAFDGTARNDELTRILRKLADQLDNDWRGGDDNGRLLDINGNSVGLWIIR